jgi:hypothetical protein
MPVLSYQPVPDASDAASVRWWVLCGGVIFGVAALGAQVARLVIELLTRLGPTSRWPLLSSDQLARTVATLLCDSAVAAVSLAAMRRNISQSLAAWLLLMTGVLLYESSDAAVDTDNRLLIQFILRLGMYWAISQLISTAMGIASVIAAGQQAIGLVGWILAALHSCADAALLITSMRARNGEAGQTTTRSHIGLIIVVLISVSIASFIAYLLQPGQLQSRGVWNLLVLCIESGSQELATLLWPIVMYCALPAHRFPWPRFSPRQAMALGATVLSVLIVVRFCVPRLYLHSGKIQFPVSAWFASPAQVAITAQIIGAVAAASIAMIRLRGNQPRFSKGVSIAIALLIVVPALSHPIINMIDFRRAPSRWSNLPSSAQYWWFASMIPWNIARCMPAIAPAYVVLKLRKSSSVER